MSVSAFLAVLLSLAGTAMGVLVPIEPESIELQPIRVEALTVAGEPTDAGRVALSSGRRRAVLLVDRSKSMDRREPAPPGSVHQGPTYRWQLVEESLLRTVDELFRTSPGIEVQIWKFGSELHRDVYLRTLGSQSDVEATKSFIRSWRSGTDGSTRLYQSIAETARAVIEDGAQRPFEWLYFGLYADGEDSGGADESLSGRSGWRDLVARLKSVARHQVVVIPVGEEARKLVGREFGAWEQATIGASIPKPPPPPCEISLRAASGWQAVAPVGPLVREGDLFTIPVNAAFGLVAASCDKLQIAERLRIAATISDGADAFALQSPERLRLGDSAITVRALRTLDDGGVLGVRLQLVSEGDVASDLRLDGEVIARFGFRPAQFPPNSDRWVFTVPRAVRIGSSAELSVSLDAAFRPVWSFADDGSKADGPVVTHVFGRPGACTISVRAESPDGKSASRSLEVEVVDATIELGGPLACRVGEEIRLEARSVGTSPIASYAWRVNGQLVGSGVSHQFRPNAPGSYRIECEATSRVGGFRFVATRSIAVAPQPRLLITSPSDVREGAQAVTVRCLVEEISGAVELSVGSFRVRQVPVYASPDMRFAILDFEVPASAFDAERTIQVVAEGSDLRDSRTLGAECAPGLRAELVSPAVESTVFLNEDTTLAFRPAADEATDVDLVDALDVEVIDAAGLRVTSGRATRQGDWKIAVRPVAGQHAGPLEVRVRVSGARLSAACPRDFVRVCGLRVAIREVDYSITAASGGAMETNAFEPFPIRLVGARPDDQISWSLDGAPFGSNAANPAVMPLGPGSYGLRARVQRPNGDQKSIDATLIVRSTIALAPESGAKHAWTRGDPPPLQIVLTGSSAELEQVAAVHWAGAVSEGADSRSAVISFPRERSEVTPVSVEARVIYRGQGARGQIESQLSATYELSPMPLRLTSAELLVGGQVGNGFRGGALEPRIQVEGVWQKRTLTYSYKPDDQAARRGITGVSRAMLSDEPIAVPDTHDGVWSVHYQFVPYGGGAPLVGEVAFTNSRSSDWIAFAAAMTAGTLVAGLFLWMGLLNRGLRYRACMGLSREEAEQPRFSVALAVVRKPRWSLFRKRARVALPTRIATAAAADASFEWLGTALKQSSDAAIVWKPSGVPRIDGLPAEEETDLWEKDTPRLRGVRRYRPQQGGRYAVPQRDLWFGYKLIESRSEEALRALCLVLGLASLFAGGWIGSQLL